MGRRLPGVGGGGLLLLAGVVVACTSGSGSSGSASGSGSETSSADTTAPVAVEPGAGEQDGGGRAVVVIDPGHNGANGAHPDVVNNPVDAGGFEKACNTVGTSTPDGIPESQVNWEVALVLQEILEDRAVEVVLTRDSDDGVGPCIDERGAAATAAGADLLVSLHADGGPPEVAGFHVIHPGERPGYTDGLVEPSEDLAVGVRDALVDAGWVAAGYVGEGGLHRRDDIGTLNRAGVPAVMVEAGNLRNPVDADVLTSADGQRDLAGALADGILAFLG